MNVDVNHFKNKLKDYYYLKSKISRIEDMMLELDVKRGVRAVQYDREYSGGSQDSLYLSLKKLDDTEKADYLDRMYIEYTNRLAYITNFIRGSEIGDSIMKIHCTGTSTYDREASKLFMSTKTLKRKVNREIAKYLERAIEL